MKKLFFTTSFSIITILSFAQLSNLDFENWTTNSGNLTLNNWTHYFNGTAMPINNIYGAWQDSNAEHGSYALTIARSYQGENNDWVKQRSSIASRPAGITGYYKYINNQVAPPYNYDTAYVLVFMTKWNTSLNQNDTIATGLAALTTNTSYTPFTCTINYINTQIPDTAIIYFVPTYINKYNRVHNVCLTGECSFLTVDNLSVLPPTDVQYVQTQYTEIYPNPVKDRLVVDLHTHISEPLQLVITDMLGKTILRSSILKTSTQIDLSQLAVGSYLIILKNETGNLQVSKFVKE